MPTAYDLCQSWTSRLECMDATPMHHSRRSRHLKPTETHDPRILMYLISGRYMYERIIPRYCGTGLPIQQLVRTGRTGSVIDIVCHSRSAEVTFGRGPSLMSRGPIDRHSFRIAFLWCKVEQLALKSSEPEPESGGAFTLGTLQVLDWWELPSGARVGQSSSQSQRQYLLKSNGFRASRPALL